MNIRELNEFELTDVINFHNDLNPQIFVNEKMRPNVHRKLMTIANHFREFLGVENIALVDITVSGSNAAYSYAPHSDIDLHLIVDFSQLPESEVYKELFDAKKYQYNDLHDLKIKGYEVELYVQDSTQPHASLGNYSVLKNDWNRFPTQRRANLNDAESKLKYEKLKQLAIRALASEDMAYTNEVLATIKRYRKAGLDAKGEFGPENLAFKMIRKDGYFEKLHAKRAAHTDSELSLEDVDNSDIEQELFADFNNFNSNINENQVNKIIKMMGIAKAGQDNRQIAMAISEAEYEGNIGIMEVMEFYKVCTPAQKDLLNRLIQAEKTKEAWALIQKVTDTNLKGDEFNEQEDLNEMGIIVKNVNTTQDVGMDEIKIQAKKMGFDVTTGGVPPLAYKHKSLYESVVKEINMSPGRLQKGVNRLLASAGPRIGLEFEVIFPGTGSEDETLWDGMSMQDIKYSLEGYGVDEHMVDAVIEDIAPQFDEWYYEKQSEWVNEKTAETFNDPSAEEEKKIEIMTDLYTFSGDADDYLEQMNRKKMTTKLAEKIIQKASAAYKKHGKVYEWPVDERTNPYLKMYHEIFVADDEQAIDEFRQFFDEEFHESAAHDYEYGVGAWLKSTGIDTIAELMADGYSDYGEDGVEMHHNIAAELSDFIGEEVEVAYTDQEIDTANNWTVMGDSSIRADDHGFFGAEIITPAMEYEEGMEKIYELYSFLQEKKARVNDTTGLHVNVSMDNIDHNNVDYTKLVLLLGDGHILKEFNREFSEFTKHSLESMKEMMDSKQGFEKDREEKAQQYAELMIKLKGKISNSVYDVFTHSLKFGKFSSVGMKNDRIEFRSMGGASYLDNFDGILNNVNRFIVAYAAAADPDAYKKEYGKKLYKLAANIGNSDDKSSMTVFAAFGSGLITKDQLIEKLKMLHGVRNAGRATNAVDTGKAVSEPTSSAEAIQMIADRHAILDVQAYQRYEEGLEIEMPTFGTEKRAAREVFRRLMNDIGHYTR